MEEDLALDRQLRWRDATCSLVKFVKTALVTPQCAQHGETIAPKVHSSRVAAENLVDCAKSIDAYGTRHTDTYHYEII